MTFHYIGKMKRIQSNETKCFIDESNGKAKFGLIYTKVKITIFNTKVNRLKLKIQMKSTKTSRIGSTLT